MVDKIVKLENNKEYLLLDKTTLDNVTYYLSVKLDKDSDPTNKYLFFQEDKESNKTYLTKVTNEDIKGLLLTSFSTNYLNMSFED